ncbi:MAG TPA: response regulator transcription factor, partial [Dehalococcoidia bacterium]|nr:response regulator transcription factor [Dehalococcoidia bacterium]
VERLGLSCRVGDALTSLEGDEATARPEAVLLDLASLDAAQARQAVEQCRKLKLPVLAVVSREMADSYDPSLNPDDLVLCPLQRGELALRLKQAMYRVNGPAGSKVLKAGDLSVDLERYDVTIGGRKVSLTYKEFQLLVLLASNPGRVYTRETLLSQIWGYDYLGGTRTVDVHIRRLRAKVEDPDHSFVETIWNVGYRFKAPGPS